MLDSLISKIANNCECISKYLRAFLTLTLPIPAYAIQIPMSKILLTLVYLIKVSMSKVSPIPISSIEVSMPQISPRQILLIQSPPILVFSSSIKIRF